MKKIPTDDHWAIIRVVSTYVPGDERSRTNPGHGYPEHTVETIEYESFVSFDAFETRVKTLTARGEKFSAVKVKPLRIKTEISVDVG